MKDFLRLIKKMISVDNKVIDGITKIVTFPANYLGIDLKLHLPKDFIYDVNNSDHKSVGQELNSDYKRIGKDFYKALDNYEE